MNADPIPLRSILDPRPPDVASREPIADAVNIPTAELRARTHELPDPAAGPIRVADVDGFAPEAIATLGALGRAAIETVALREHSPPTGSPGRLWSPTEFLREWLASLPSSASPKGRALDLGCGTGRDAVYLAACGWQVRAVDIDPTAITRASELQHRYPHAARRIDWEVADVDSWTVPAADAPFDLIVCFRFLPRAFLAKAGQQLKPGGSLLLETFSPSHAARHGRPAARERVLSIEDATSIAHSAALHILRCAGTERGDVQTTRVHAIRQDPASRG